MKLEPLKFHDIKKGDIFLYEWWNVWYIVKADYIKDTRCNNYWSCEVLSKSHRHYDFDFFSDVNIRVYDNKYYIPNEML